MGIQKESSKGIIHQMMSKSDKDNANSTWKTMQIQHEMPKSDIGRESQS